MNDQELAAQWAANMMDTEFCILDTETTGLETTAQICQLAIVNQLGDPLFNSLIKPTVPIEPDAAAIHGITDADVATAPTFQDMFIPILQAIGRRDVVIYNAEFDLRLIRQTARAYDIPLAFPTSERRGTRIWIGGGGIHCAMLHYAAYCGDWIDWRGAYRWQRLPGGDHSAIGDCLATLAVIRRMAESHQPESAKNTLEGSDF